VSAKAAKIADCALTYRPASGATRSWRIDFIGLDVHDGKVAGCAT
jgi:hypothetical protein